MYDNEKLEMYLKHNKFSKSAEKDGYTVINNIDDVKFNITDEKTAIYKEVNYGVFSTKSWQVFLKKCPNDYFYNNYIKNKKIGAKHFCHSNDIHRGHYIGNQLDKFLILEDRLYCDKVNKIRNNDINHFFGKGNPINIYYQTRTANCNADDNHGQLYFENDIVKFLTYGKDDGDDNGGRKIYYEIEDILFDEKSIGRKLTILKFEENIWNKEESHHVFIPNILDEDDNKQ